MAYIGNIVVGANGSGDAGDTKYANRFQAGSSFTATLMGTVLYSVPSVFKLGIYSDNAGEPDALLGQTPEITGIAGGRKTYQADLVSGVALTSGTYYWLTIITSTGGGRPIALGAGTERYNTDTYSDGFADPFGSASSGTNLYTIWAADDPPIIATGDISLGGAVLETSIGTKLLVAIAALELVVYNNLDGTPTVIAAKTRTNIFGTTGSIGGLAAAIDSNDVIHIVCACATEETRDVAYVTLSTPDGTPSWGAFEEAYNYTEQAPNYPGCAISIDSNDKPHIAVVDNVKMAGSSQDNVYYTEKTGASWATPTQIGVRAVKAYFYTNPHITLRNSDDVEAWYYFNENAYDPAYRTYSSSSWGSESTYNEADAHFGGITAKSDGTVYRYHVSYSPAENIKENHTDTGYDTVDPGVIHAEGLASPALVGSDRFILYIDTGDDVHLISNDGGGWTDEGDLEVGTFETVIAGWSYNNLNNTTTIDYLYSDGTNIYWGEKTFGTATSTSQAAYVKGQDTTKDNQAAYIAGSLDTSTSFPAYVKGALGATTSQAAFIQGSLDALTSFPAFIHGSLDTSTSFPAYIEGVLGATSSQAAYIQGSLDDLTSFPAFIAGSLDTSTSFPAYVQGVAGALTNQPAFIQGYDTASTFQAAFIQGYDTALDNQAAFIHGSLDTSDNQAAFIQGQDTALDNQAAYTRGSLDAKTSFPAYIMGDVLEAKTNQAAFIQGQDTASTNQPAYVLGALGALDNQAAFIQGQDTAVDNQAAFIAGSLDTETSFPAFIAGSLEVLDNQAAFITGGVEVLDNQVAFIQGQDTASTNQPAYVLGALGALDNQAAFIQGQDTAVDNQAAFIAGSLDDLTSFPAFIAGSLDTSDSQAAFIAGSLDDLTSFPAYVAGSLNVLDNQAAFIKGQEATKTSQAAYVAGLTYFPFTDDFTGGNGTPWSIAKWETSVVT